MILAGLGWGQQFKTDSRRDIRIESTVRTEGVAVNFADQVFMDPTEARESFWCLKAENFHKSPY